MTRSPEILDGRVKTLHPKACLQRPIQNMRNTINQGVFLSLIGDLDSDRSMAVFLLPAVMLDTR